MLCFSKTTPLWKETEHGKAYSALKQKLKDKGKKKANKADHEKSLQWQGKKSKKKNSKPKGAKQSFQKQKKDDKKSHLKEEKKTLSQKLMKYLKEKMLGKAEADEEEKAEDKKVAEEQEEAEEEEEGAEEKAEKEEKEAEKDKDKVEEKKQVQGPLSGKMVRVTSEAAGEGCFGLEGTVISHSESSVFLHLGHCLKVKTLHESEVTLLTGLSKVSCKNMANLSKAQKYEMLRAANVRTIRNEWGTELDKLQPNTKLMSSQHICLMWGLLSFQYNLQKKVCFIGPERLRHLILTAAQTGPESEKHLQELLQATRDEVEKAELLLCVCWASDHYTLLAAEQVL